ncbi:MAG TPA: hypothetical protein VFQ65_01920 [Kofleriaceae bacterium]|nr:hypothetical protein [Kofleriaceae bacterium]
MATDKQRGLTWLAAISALLVVASFMAAKAARDATLLSHYSIRSLPLFVGLSAVLSLPIIIVAGKLMMRYGPHRLVPAMNAVSGVVALGEYLMMASFPRTTAVIVFFHLSTASAVLVSGFWSIVNERFDIHSAKRHIGRIGMGATFGGILGGVIAERTAVYFKPDSILLVLAVMQGVCAVALWAFGRNAAMHEPPATESTWSGLATVTKSHLLRKAGLVVVITAVAAGALDYVFKADIVHGGSKSDLLRSLAVFYTVTNVITAIVQVALCGPVLAFLGVPRSVSTLPYTIAGFGILSLFIKVPTMATVARGAELVTRNSIYRAGYELLYAPLPPDQKRPTKVVLDVGADKLGDILAAQLVGAIVYSVADSRSALLLAAAIAGGLGILITLRLPKSYTQSLEAGLLENVGELPLGEGQPEPWVSLAAMPSSFNHPGDVIPLQMRRRRRARTPALPPPPPVAVAPNAPNDTERLLRLIRELRSSDVRRVRAALAEPLPTEVARIAIELVGGTNNEIATLAADALRVIAPRCTGALVDTLLDTEREERLRRRLPAIIAAGVPDLAAWGLWRGMSDPSFEVRYRCSHVLAELAIGVHLGPVNDEEVFEYVRKELLVDHDEWKARTVENDPVIALQEADANVGLAHVFRALGLVLPAEPLRVALHAVLTEDSALRGMALEYLESILPPDVRAQLWPLIDGSADAETALHAVVAADSAASSNEFLNKMRAVHPHIFEKMHLRKSV